MSQTVQLVQLGIYNGDFFLLKFLRIPAFFSA